MKLKDVLNANNIFMDLKGENKKEIFKDFIDHLIEIGSIPAEKREDVYNGLMKRENEVSTAIGNGVAVPHCRSKVLEKLIFAMGIKQNGIVYNDDQVVNIFFVIICPENQPKKLLSLLAAISRKFKNESFKNKILAQNNSSKVLELLK